MWKCSHCEIENDDIQVECPQCGEPPSAEQVAEIESRVGDSSNGGSGGEPFDFYILLGVIALVLVVGGFFTENLHTLKEIRQGWLGPSWGGPEGIIGILICIVALLFHLVFYYVPWPISLVMLLISLYMIRKNWLDGKNHLDAME